MSLDMHRLNHAIQEAERFLNAAEDAKARLRDDKHAIIRGSAETATCRRTSMDLTRALALLRKGTPPTDEDNG